MNKPMTYADMVAATGGVDFVGVMPPIAVGDPILNEDGHSVAEQTRRQNEEASRLLRLQYRVTVAEKASGDYFRQLEVMTAAKAQWKKAAILLIVFGAIDFALHLAMWWLP